MKKTVKLILVVTVIAILSLMATSAYAYEIGDTVTWQYECGEGETGEACYVYAGEFKEGMNNVERSNEDRVYKFEAKESGYYFISECGGIFFEEKSENGKLSGFEEIQYMTDDEGDIGSIVYLEKGTHFALLYLEYGTTIKIEYYGTIEKTTFGENGNFILNEDAFIFDSEAEIVGAYGYNLTVEFSNGRSLANHYDIAVEFYLADELKSGENEVIYKLPGGYEEKTTVTIYEITDIIESVEISNIGRYTTVYEDYTGENKPVSIEGETLSVKFTDGTEYTATVNERNEAEIPLSCGKTVTAYLGQNWFDEFYIVIAEEYYERICCEKEGMMLGENIKALHENNMESLRWSINILRIAVEKLRSDPVNAGDYFRWSANEFVDIFRNISSFTLYYLTLTK